MCWADKLAMLWAFVICFFLVLIANDKAGMVSVLFSGEGLKMFALFVLPIWVFLRLIDWTLGGPARRKWAIRARVVRF